MENKERILITGSTGMLGKDIYTLLKSEGYDVFGISRNMGQFSDYLIDLTNEKQLLNFLDMSKPQIIIHCAANTDVNDCELNKENAFLLNVKSTEILSSFSNDVRFIYVSTDSVFDGQKGNFKEVDQTNPLNYYAYTKLEAEKAVINNNKNSVILRTNIYGYHINRGKSLFEWAFNNLKHNQIINGFQDVYFNPLYTKQLSKVIKALVDNKKINGIFHAGCKEKISKYDFIKKVAEKFTFETSMITAKSIDEFSSETKRPKDTTLESSKLSGILDMEFGIDEGINLLYSDYV
jgi:dTDP-4-dehydrorhamnose reductase